MDTELVEAIGSLPISQTLTGSLARAANYARDQAHADVALEHLLLSLAEDPDALRIMTLSGVDIDRLTSDVSNHLGRIEEHLPAGSDEAPAVSDELKRILKGAAAASRGRRREIDGAIVLAAIVGDGKSAAAHILSGQGMTFETAIRALQSTQDGAQPNQSSDASPGYDGAQDLVQHASGPPPRRPDRPQDRPAPNAIIAAARSKVQARQNAGGEHTASEAEEREVLSRLELARRAYEERKQPAFDSAHAPEEHDEGDAQENPDAESGDRGVARAGYRLPVMPPVAGGRPMSPRPRPIPQQQERRTPPASELTAERERRQAPPVQPSPPPLQQQRPQQQPAPRHPTQQGPQSQGFQQQTDPHRPGPGPDPGSRYAPGSHHVPESRPPSAQDAYKGPSPAAQRPPPPHAPQRHAEAPGQHHAAPRPRHAPPPYPPEQARHAQNVAPPPGMSRAPQADPRPQPPPPGFRPIPPPPRPYAGPPPDLRLPQSANQQHGQPPVNPYAPGGNAPPAERIGEHELTAFIPPRLTAGRTTVIEIELPRAKLVHLDLSNGSALESVESVRLPPTAVVLRLRAPEGGFYIEPISAETQWLGAGPNALDGPPISWRWNVTPKRAGRFPIQALIAGRSIAPDGLASETALPHQTVEVRVRGNIAPALASTVRLLAAFGLGAALVLFSGPILDFAETALKTITGGGA